MDLITLYPIVINDKETRRQILYGVLKCINNTLELKRDKRSLVLNFGFKCSENVISLGR